MDLKKLFTLAAIPALALTLTACGGKKPAASAPAADKGKVADEVKTYMATVAPEYKEFDEANQCFVVKSGADKYCMVPQTPSRIDAMYRDKTRLNFVFLTTKGKFVKDGLDEHADGGFAIYVTDKDTGALYAKMPFTKAWSASKQYSTLQDKWERKSANFMNNRFGKGIAGISVSEETVLAWPKEEKAGEFINGADRKIIESVTWYALDGKEFRKVAKLRTKISDAKKNLHNTVNTAFLKAGTDEATGYDILKADVTVHEGDVQDKKSFDLKYNPAKKAYDIPVELRKVMKEQ